MPDFGANFWGDSQFSPTLALLRHIWRVEADFSSIFLDFSG
jgi:hypothetical protein